VSQAQPSGEAESRHVILYDGVCALCNGLVQFVLRRDARCVFDFAPLQSRAGHELLARFGRNPDDLNTVYVIAGYRSAAPALHARARAALFIMRVLGAPWSWVGVLGVLPDGVLNRGYDLIARNRYRWFGRYQSCLLPRADDRHRFIDA